MNMENNKTSEPHKFILSLPQRLNLRNSNKHASFQFFFLFNTRGKIQDNSTNTINLK